MYDRVTGELVELSPTSAVIDVGGIGYELAVPLSTYDQLKGRRGTGESQARLFTYLHVREDELRLYGFASDQERRLFRLVLSVNGVGPSIALACLSLLSPEEALNALAAGDVKTLQRVKGVGRRVAERMVVDLKDRAAVLATTFTDVGSSRGAASSAHPSDLAPSLQEDAVRALVELGFPRKAAETRVAGVLEELSNADSKADLESLIKACLRP